VNQSFNSFCEAGSPITVVSTQSGAIAVDRDKVAVSVIDKGSVVVDWRIIFVTVVSTQSGAIAVDRDKVAVSVIDKGSVVVDWRIIFVTVATVGLIGIVLGAITIGSIGAGTT
jgi:lipopolysaccharide/colanic/teichoic acid biosynthesis glycosyltransferase